MQGGRGWGGEGRGRLGLKSLNSSQLHPPPRGAGLKLCPILVVPPLRGGENRVERSGQGRIKQGRAKVSSLVEREQRPITFERGGKNIVK